MINVVPIGAGAVNAWWIGAPSAVDYLSVSIGTKGSAEPTVSWSGGGFIIITTATHGITTYSGLIGHPVLARAQTNMHYRIENTVDAGADCVLAAILRDTPAESLNCTVETSKSKAGANLFRYMTAANADQEVALYAGGAVVMNDASGYKWFSSNALDASPSIHAAQIHRRVYFEAKGGNAETFLVYRGISWVRGLFMYEPDYRTIFVRNDASTTRMRTFRRQPNEVLPYDIDFTEWLAPLITDEFELAMASVTGVTNGDVGDISIAAPTPLDKDPYGSTIPVARFKLWITGGVDGATYKITVMCGTRGGRMKEVDFLLRVVEV